MEETGGDTDSEEEAEDALEEGEIRGWAEEPSRARAAEDGRRVKAIGDPRRPTEAEVEEHERGNHCPYRNWCGVCVRARGKDMDHRADAMEARGLSEYSFDYCFLGDEFGCKLTTLVGKERKTGCVMATAVPTKSSTGRFSIDKILDFVDEVGDSAAQIIIKSDQEPSIVSLAEDVVKAREEGRTVVEESPKQSSGSIGVVERAVQEVEGQMRALLLAVETRLGEEMKPTEPLAQFIPEFAAYLMNRLMVGKDGKSAAERIKGKRATVVGAEFGEKLLWKLPKQSKMAKMKQRWEYGIFVGVRRRSGELWVVDKVGKVQAVRSVRRIPLQERWGGDTRRWVKGVPWHRYKGDEYEDGEMPEGVEAEEVVKVDGSIGSS